MYVVMIWGIFMLSLELGQKARPLLGFGWWSSWPQYPKVFGRNAVCGTFLIILEVGEEEAGCY